MTKDIQNQPVSAREKAAVPLKRYKQDTVEGHQSNSPQCRGGLINMNGESIRSRSRAHPRAASSRHTSHRRHRHFPSHKKTPVQALKAGSTN